MNRKRLEDQIRAVAAFAEAGSDLEENDKRHANDLFAGSRWILGNSTLAAHAPELLAALESLMDDYNQDFQAQTDSQFGRDPGTPAYRRAVRLVRKLSA